MCHGRATEPSARDIEKRENRDETKRMYVDIHIETRGEYADGKRQGRRRRREEEGYGKGVVIGSGVEGEYNKERQG